MGRIIVLTGLLIAGTGCLIMIGVPLGRLPGDFVYRRGSSTIYLPVATSVVLSAVLTGISFFVRR